MSAANAKQSESPSIIWPYQAGHWRDRWFNTVGDEETPTTYAGLAAVLSACYGGQLRMEDLNDFLMLYSKQEYAVENNRLFDHIVPFMYKLINNATGLPSYALLPGDNVKISRRNVATILAMMLFGMFDYVHISIDEEDVPQITMLKMFKTQNISAFACVIGYFDTMVESVCSYPEAFEATILIYSRVMYRAPAADCFTDESAMSTVSFEATVGNPREIKVCSIDELPIEDVFDRSANYTMLLFEHTELLITGALIPRLNVGESIIVYGADKFNEFNGRQYAGAAECHYDYGSGCNLMAKIAIILVPPETTNSTRRVSVDFMRDFDKLRVAFAAVRPVDSPVTISQYMIPWTVGNGGNMYSTFLQAWLAASMSGRSLIFPTTDCNLRESAARFVVWSRRGARTVGTLLSHWKMTVDQLLEGKRSLSEVNLFSAMESYRNEKIGDVRFRSGTRRKEEEKRRPQQRNDKSRPMDDYRMVVGGHVNRPRPRKTQTKPTGKLPPGPFDGY